MNPVVSVVIPAYRHAPLILETLQSVFTQTFDESVEVIVVNDGSPDNTAEVLSPLVSTGQIVYVEQTNQGQAAARNRGIGVARGEFIALLDDDDLMPPDKLKWQVAALRSNPSAGIVYGVPQCIDDTGKAIVAKEPLGTPFPWQFFIPVENDMYGKLIRGNYLVSPGQTLIRRDALLELGEPFDTDAGIRGCDDWDLWLRLAEKVPFVAEDLPGLFYRLHANNASKNWKAMMQSAFLVHRKHLQRQRNHPHRLKQVRDANRYLRCWMGDNLIPQAMQDRERGDGAVALEKLNLVLCHRPQHFLRDRNLRFYLVTLWRQRIKNKPVTAEKAS